MKVCLVSDYYENHILKHFG